MKPGSKPPYTNAKPASNLQRPAPLPSNGLRNFLIFFLLLVAAFGAYAYRQDPAGCQKVLADSRVVVSSLLPGHAAETDRTPIVGASFASPEGNSASVSSGPSAPSTDAPAVAPAPATPPPPPVTSSPSTNAEPGAASASASSAPTTFPAQPNWTWILIDGKTYNNVVITKIDGDTVSITHSTGISHLPMSLLPDDIKKQLHYDPAVAAAAAAQVTRLISGKLVNAAGAPVKAPDNVQYYAIYYSAGWCPPCHAFTPRLVAWYNKFKAGHPNFEVIFVSDDRSQAAMLVYMKEMAMPWLAIDFTEITHDGGGIEKYAGPAIPDLVLVDADGKVLANSFEGVNYVGPGAVVDQINQTVGGSTPVPL